MTSPAASRDARAWSYDELVREGVALIPAYAPDWTDHNASDPGITLVELLAYFSEVLAYRALRVTPDAKLNFLRLLQGSDWTGWKDLIGQPADRLDRAIEDAVRQLSRQQSLASMADFERAALHACLVAPEPRDRVRALAVPGVDLRRLQAPRDADAAAEAAGDVSVVLAPEAELDADALARLCQKVQRALAPRCPLTTRVHVVAPVFLHLHVACNIALLAGNAPAAVRAAIGVSLRRRFGPAHAEDAPAAEVRPFGRTLHLSEIVDVIGLSPGVAWVDGVEIRRVARPGADDRETRVGLRIGVVATLGEDTRLGGAASIELHRFERDDAGEVVSMRVQPWEIVRVQLAHDSVFAAPWQDAGR